MFLSRSFLTLRPIYAADNNYFISSTLTVGGIVVVYPSFSLYGLFLVFSDSQEIVMS